jgi:hypothetical protein
MQHGEVETVTQQEIRVGIVGADNKASWAKVSHVPAIKGRHESREPDRNSDA